MRNHFLLIAMPLVLTGCVNQFASMPDESVKDPIDFIEQYQAATEKGLINPVGFIGGTTEEENHRIFQKKWCSNYDEIHLLNEFKRICNANNGITRESWCVEQKTDLPLFEMYISTSGGCSVGTSMVSVVTAPHKGADIHNQDWLNIASANGYKTRVESEIAKKKQVEISKKHEAEIQENLRKEKLRKAQESEIMLTTRGLRICQKAKYDYQGQYTGFVEDFTDKKIKVHVAHLGGDGWSTSGFKQSTIWDYPANWFICE